MRARTAAMIARAERVSPRIILNQWRGSLFSSGGRIIRREIYETRSH